MKELNRRAFLTLTGAAVAMMALAACDDGPYTPPAPPAPTTSKEAELLAAINKVWKKKYEAKEVVHEQLTLNQDAVGLISAYGRVFETANEIPHKLTTADLEMLGKETTKFDEEMKKKYGNKGFAGMVYASDVDTEGTMTLEYQYSCEDAAVQAFVKELLNSASNSSKAEYISFYFPEVQGTTYMTATIFLNDKA